MLGTNIGIDLGTTSILIFVEGKGIVVSEPSAVAFDTDTGRLLAIGQKAADMIGRTPDSITVVKPMRSGVISDFTATKAIVRVLLYKVCKNMVFKPNIVVCMPSTVTNLEKRTILDLVTAAGAGRACLIEEPRHSARGLISGARWARWSSISAAELRISQLSPWAVSQFQNRSKSPAISSTRI